MTGFAKLFYFRRIFRCKLQSFYLEWQNRFRWNCRKSFSAHPSIFEFSLKDLTCFPRSFWFGFVSLISLWLYLMVFRFISFQVEGCLDALSQDQPRKIIPNIWVVEYRVCLINLVPRVFSLSWVLLRLLSYFTSRMSEKSQLILFGLQPAILILCLKK